MLESLTNQLANALHQLWNKGRLTEKDIDEALRKVRLVLLEADVNFKVARDFLNQIRDKTVGEALLDGINPYHQVVKIVHEEMTNLLSAGDHRLSSVVKRPMVAMIVGLQGSGKTTTAAKLALYCQKQDQSPVLVACDLRRPAAIDQLAILGNQLAIPVHKENHSSKVTEVASNGIQKAKELGATWAILDTSGRLHIDETLMVELEEIKVKVAPTEILLIVDSMTGQDAVRSAQAFHERIGLTGLVLSKLDGDSKGGAALSISKVTGIPIKFIGTGEKLDDLEPFYPDRLASRILGMGDVLSLVEKARVAFDQKQAQELERKIRKNRFDLEDFLEQLQGIKKMGPLSNLLELLPSLPGMNQQSPFQGFDEGQLKRTEAMIRSMTARERHHPEIIGGSRRRRIALGSGTTPQDVNRLLNQFRQGQKLMRRINQKKGAAHLFRRLPP